MIGFVILSHNNPEQLRKLIDTLDRLYDRPPIACHHDISQSPLDKSAFPPNVRFVEDHVRTGWGRWSLVVGFLRALALLYRDADPDWFVLLSAADYPLKSAEDVAAGFRTADVDAFLDLRAVGGGGLAPRHIGSADPILSHHENTRLATLRYLHARVALPTLRGSRADVVAPDFLDNERRRYRIPTTIGGWPFGRRFTCYVGSQWFSGNRRVARKLIEPDDAQLALRRYYSSRWVADESFVHTLLGNDPEIRLDIDPRRFTIWDRTGAHPEILGLDDLPAMRASRAIFGRKFAYRSTVVDRIDAALGIA